jgi:hypothetical protein
MIQHLALQKAVVVPIMVLTPVGQRRLVRGITAGGLTG